MKTPFVLPGWVLLLAVAAGGCATEGGVSAREKEKATVYATLQPWQKHFIERGVVAKGFSTDMVYMAMGQPSKVETKDFPQGRAELWTYDRYYPYIDAAHGFRFAPFSTESPYQPQMITTQTNISRGDYSLLPGGATVPIGMDRKGGESAFTTSGPQGGSMEPATLRSYRMQVLFNNGKAIQIAAMPNVN